MLLGVVSDSHDRKTAIANAVAALSARGATHLVHAGDIIAPFAGQAWRAFPGPITAVYGNCDGERRGLGRVIGDIHEPPHTFELDGRSIVLAHDPEVLTPAVVKGADLVLFGHTHVVETRTEGGTLFLNPGEVCGYVKGRRSCAVVDLATLTVEIIDL